MRKILTILILLTLPAMAGAPAHKEPEPPSERIMIQKNTFVGMTAPDTQPMGYREITAYSSSPDECWGDPTITASGEKVRHGIIASNELAFGDWVNIDGLGEFVVKDRMHQRYDYRIDIWFPSKEAALEFGIKTLWVDKLTFY